MQVSRLCQDTYHCGACGYPLYVGPIANSAIIVTGAVSITGECRTYNCERRGKILSIPIEVKWIDAPEVSA